MDPYLLLCDSGNHHHHCCHHDNIINGLAYFQMHVLVHLCHLLKDLFGTGLAVFPPIMNVVIGGISTDAYSSCSIVIILAVSLVVPDTPSDLFLNLNPCYN
jgi:hypothetical protein